VDATIIWNLIDSSKLKVGLERTLKAVQAHAKRRGYENLKKNGAELPEPVQLHGQKTIDNFPALYLYVRKWKSCCKMAAVALGLLVFTDVVCKLSSLSPPKKMDAETAAAQGGKKQIPQYRPIKSFCAT
jgi:hypothetical protein